MVSRCLRCGEFKERDEMESRTTEEYAIVCMCMDCWKKVDTKEMLIQEAKKYLTGYHIDLSKYTGDVIHDDGVTATVCFTSNETKMSIYVGDCYYTETEIMQATVYF